MSEPAASDYNADALIDEIDAGTLVPRSRPVIRALFDRMTALNPLQQEVLAAFDAGEELDAMLWGERLWPEIEALPYEQQGGLRLLVGLVNSDRAVDWYEAGYLVEWSRQVGLQDWQIGEAFHQS